MISWAMGEAKQPGKVQEKVQKHGPWVAIATAAIIPFFAYMQSSREADLALAQASQAQRQVDQSEADVETVEESAGAWVKLLVREQERLADDVEACHERVDLLADELEEMASTPRRNSYTASRVAEQRMIERPAAAREAPSTKGDVPAGDPLSGLLGE